MYIRVYDKQTKCKKITTAKYGNGNSVSKEKFHCARFYPTANDLHGASSCGMG